jgi:hypothetical protein
VVYFGTGMAFAQVTEEKLKLSGVALPANFPALSLN